MKQTRASHTPLRSFLPHCEFCSFLFPPRSPTAVPAVSDDVKAEAMASLTKLVRNRRNVQFLLPQFKRLPDFWGWYKYFMDSHNQEGVSEVSH